LLDSLISHRYFLEIEEELENEKGSNRAEMACASVGSYICCLEARYLTSINGGMPKYNH